MNYCMLGDYLYRYKSIDDDGEFYFASENCWYTSVSPSIKKYCDDGGKVTFLTELEAIEQFPEAFQEPEVKYCLYRGWLYFYTDENDLRTYWKDGKWNKSEIQPIISFLVKDNRAIEITKEQAIEMFPEAFQENDMPILNY